MKSLHSCCGVTARVFFVLAMFFVFLTTGYLYADSTAQYKYTAVCFFLKNEFFSY